MSGRPRRGWMSSTAWPSRRYVSASSVHSLTASSVDTGWLGSIHGLIEYSTVKYVGSHIR